MADPTTTANTTTSNASIPNTAAPTMEMKPSLSLEVKTEFSGSSGSSGVGRRESDEQIAIGPAFSYPDGTPITPKLPPVTPEDLAAVVQKHSFGKDFTFWSPGYSFRDVGSSDEFG